LCSFFIKIIKAGISRRSRRGTKKVSALSYLAQEAEMYFISRKIVEKNKKELEEQNLAFLT
jgi:hypothetical protein